MENELVDDNVYELVDDKSLSWDVSKKTTEKRIHAKYG